MSELQGKLLELRGCFDRGLLDKKEYDQARAAVLDGFTRSSAPSSVDLSASLAELASAITKIANWSAAVTVSFLFVLLLMATMS